MTTFYDEIGGYPTIEKIVATFYAGVADDPVLRPLYPEEDLGPAEERFRLFLVQYWGGPTTYSDTRGHPRLRMRHAPFAVTPAAAERWLVHFREGLDSVDLTPEQDAQFWDYVTHAAQFMVNTFEEVQRRVQSPGAASSRSRTSGGGAAGRLVAGSTKTIATRARDSSRSPSQISDAITIDRSPTWRQPGPRVVRLGTEQDRHLVVDVRARRDHPDRHAAPRSSPFQSRAVNRMRASMKYSKYFTLLTCP